MELKRAGLQPSQKGPAKIFTGTVRIDPLHTASPAGARGVRERHFRARRPYGLAHGSPGPDAGRHRRLRLDPVRG